MKAKNKFLYIFWPVSTILFIVASVSVIMLASGYRLNLKNFKLNKTGTIVIETIPVKATVYIDKKAVCVKTPCSISYLWPGRYDIKIVADERKNWEKTLTVEAEKVTYQRGVILLNQTISPKEYANNDSNLFTSDPDLIISGNELFDGELFITRLSSNILTAVKVKNNYIISTEGKLILVSADGKSGEDVLNVDSNAMQLKFIESSHQLIWQNEATKILSAQIY